MVLLTIVCVFFSTMQDQQQHKLPPQNNIQQAVRHLHRSLELVSKNKQDQTAKYEVKKKMTPPLLLAAT